MPLLHDMLLCCSVPQIFSCASGTYLMGTERHFSANNNLVISKMLDDKGEWRGVARCWGLVGKGATGAVWC